jgi:hypothetical protein
MKLTLKKIIMIFCLLYFQNVYSDCSVTSEDFHYSYKRYSQDNSKYFVLSGRWGLLNHKQNMGVYLANNDEPFYIFSRLEFKNISDTAIFNAFIDNDGNVYEVPNHLCKEDKLYKIKVFKKNEEVKQIPVKLQCKGKKIKFSRSGYFNLFYKDTSVRIENSKLKIMTSCGDEIKIDLKKYIQLK